MAKRTDVPLETRGLRLERAGRPVLRGVDLSFSRGRITTIVGPSGAGKSSLLRCLNRLEEPSDGCVLLDGTDIRDMRPTDLRRRVGMIFQSPVLFEGDIATNVGYGLSDVDPAAVTRSLRAAGLDEGLCDRSAKELSVGQAQRACIARALVREPEVLLFDEPTSALDVRATDRIEALMKDLAAGGLAIVLVTHDLDQARHVADEVHLLVEGAVTASGSIDDVAAAWPKDAIDG